VVLSALVTGDWPLSAQAKQIVAPAGLLIPGIPYSPGVRSGPLLHVAGTVATDAGGKMVPGDIEAQTRKTLDNVGAILKAGGLDFQDVVAVNVYLHDIRHMDGMARAYREVFKTNPPVMAVIEAALPLEGSLVEITAIAAQRGLPRRIVRPAGWSTNALYSRAIAVGDFIFLAGLVAEDPKTGKPVAGDMRVQTRQVLDNAKALVEGAGFAMDDLTVARAWVADARDLRVMNEVYTTYFGDLRPTRASVRVKLPSPEYKIGLMFSGVRGEKRSYAEVKPGAPPPALSPAIEVGNTLFTAGLVQGGRGDARAQTRGILTQIETHLKRAGMDFTNVVSATVWLEDLRYFAAMNEVYNEFFKTDLPARATIGTGMSCECLVEIAVIATK
jgi:enamine deaminase RidA (YjgF/YER057c/UK114 family)